MQHLLYIMISCFFMFLFVIYWNTADLLQAYERARTIEQVEKFGVGVCINSIILFLFSLNILFILLSFLLFHLFSLFSFFFLLVLTIYFIIFCLYMFRMLLDVDSIW